MAQAIMQSITTASESQLRADCVAAACACLCESRLMITPGSPASPSNTEGTCQEGPGRPLSWQNAPLPGQQGGCADGGGGGLLYKLEIKTMTGCIL